MVIAFAFATALAPACAQRQQQEPQAAPPREEPAPQEAPEPEQPAARAPAKKPEAAEQLPAEHVENIAGRVESLREQAARVAADQGGTAGATQALTALAEALDAVLPPDTEEVERVRDSARQLEQLGDLSLERVEVIKAGLGAATDALARLSASSGQSALDAWVESARGAVDRIDARLPLSLQRAAVQDALRSVVDTYAVATQLPAWCEAR